MGSSFKLITAAELADMFGLTLGEFHRRRRRYGWPCTQLGRSDFRFTDDQVRQILGMQARATTPKKPAGGTGQTRRSRARSA